MHIGIVTQRYLDCTRNLSILLFLCLRGTSIKICPARGLVTVRHQILRNIFCAYLLDHQDHRVGTHPIKLAGTAFDLVYGLRGQAGMLGYGLFC